MRKKKYNQQSYHNVSETRKTVLFFFSFSVCYSIPEVSEAKFQNQIARTNFLISSFVHYVTLDMLFNSSKFFILSSVKISQSMPYNGLNSMS